MKAVKTAGIIMLMSAGAVRAQTWLPVAGGTQDWGLGANWSGGAPPSAAGAAVTISGALAANQSIDVTTGADVHYTLGSLTIGATGGTYIYTLIRSFSSNLIFDNSASAATITHVGNNADIIARAIQISAAGLHITDNSTGGNLTFGDGANGNRVMTGTGNVTISGGVQFANNYELRITGTLTWDAAGGTARSGVNGIVTANVSAIVINRAAKADVVAFSGANTFAGDISLVKGTLGIYANNTFNNAGITLTVANNADTAINLRAGMTIGGLAGSGNINTASGAALSVITLAGGGTYAFNPNGSYDGGGGTKVALNVALAPGGEQTFTGNWNMSGGVTVSGGRFVVGADNVFAGSNYSQGTLLIDGGRLSTAVAGANFATGNTAGTGNSIQLELRSGALDLNGADVGKLTLGSAASPAPSNFTMSGGTLELTIVSAASYDQIIGSAAGDLFTISGGLIDLTGSVIDYDAAYQIFSGFATGSVTGLSFAGLDNDHTAWLDNTGALRFQTIPEPSPAALLVLACLLASGLFCGKKIFRRLMKTIPIGIILAVALPALAVAQQAPPDNLLYNSSFEEQRPPGESSPAAYWGHYIRADKDKPAITAAFTLTGSGAQDGKSAGRIEAPADQEPSKALAEWYQRVLVKPETRYYFSVWQRGATIRCWAPACLEELNEKKQHTGRGATAKPAEGESGRLDPERWQMIETVVVTGTDTRMLHISLRLQGLGGGWVEYDNAKLIELPPEK